jgi:hypothetical protein
MPQGTSHDVPAATKKAASGRSGFLRAWRVNFHHCALTSVIWPRLQAKQPFELAELHLHNPSGPFDTAGERYPTAANAVTQGGFGAPSRLMERPPYQIFRAGSHSPHLLSFGVDFYLFFIIPQKMKIEIKKVNSGG